MTDTDTREKAAREFLGRVRGTAGDNELPEAYRGKPDQDEPWRYVCPDCAGNVTSNRYSPKYRCYRCNGLWAYRELHDKKRGMKVGVGNE